VKESVKGNGDGSFCQGKKAPMASGRCSGIFPCRHALGSAFVGAAPLSLSQIWAVRVPRICLAVLVGASLATAGTCLQALFRNPLADPFLLGIAAGGALGAAGGLLFGVPSFLIPAVAFAMALLTAWLVYRLGRINGTVRMDTLLLAGVAVNAFLSSLLTLLLYLNAHRLLVSAVYFWLMGGFQMATWREVGMVVPYALIGFFGAPLLRPCP